MMVMLLGEKRKSFSWTVTTLPLGAGVLLPALLATEPVVAVAAEGAGVAVLLSPPHALRIRATVSSIDASAARRPNFFILFSFLWVLKPNTAAQRWTKINPRACPFTRTRRHYSR